MSIDLALLIAALGLVAGLMTTLGGFGGGQFLVNCLALVWSPITALTVSSMALLFGNGQRLYLFRHDVDRKAALPVVLGVIPGAMAGALLAAIAPIALLRGALVFGALIAVVRVLSRSDWRVPSKAMAPLALVIGFLSATTGGGGFLLSVLFLSAGVRGNCYVACLAATGVTIHIVRISGYSTTGLLDFSLLAQVGIIALALMLGNLLGRKIRLHFGEHAFYWIEGTLPALAAALAIAGLFV